MKPEQVMQEIEKLFESQREEMIQDLRKAYSRVKFPAETHHIYFEFDFVGSMCYSINGWIRDEDDDLAIFDKNLNEYCQLGGGFGVMAYEVDKFFLQDEFVNLDPDEWGELVDDYHWEMEEYMIEWFADCWKEVGEQNANKYPTYVGFDNDSQILDLGTREWIDKKLINCYF